jgi:hypothetical protein
LVLSRESRAGTPDRSLQCHLTHDDDHDDGATVVPISTITSLILNLQTVRYPNLH